MTVTTGDGLALILALPMAVLLTSTTFVIAVGVSTADSTLRPYAVLLGTICLGFGLWATMVVQALSVELSEQPHVGLSRLALPSLVAASSQACALLFVARCEPDNSSIAGSAFALAVGVAATHWAALDELPGQAAHAGLLWAAGSFLLTFALLFGALYAWFKFRHDRSRRAGWVRVAAAFASAMGILGANAQAVANSRPTFGPCCETLPPASRLLAISAAALGCAVLAVAQVVAICVARLQERSSRNARELEEVHARLRYLATHDSLTGLPNRQRFKDRLAKSIADTQRPGRAIAIAVCDIDHFSTINHSLGHGVGDWLLTEVARRITAVLPGSMLLARLGGDEFAVLIDHVAARLEAHTVTSEILAAFDTPLRVNGLEVTVRCAIGVSVWPDDGRRSDDLLVHAEVAMTIAKERGGGQVLFFREGMTNSMRERLALENDLRRALAAEEFELYYQPEISVKTGRIAAAEALLRWRHPTKGIIGPNSFIALAEETGLIIPLGEWALRQACRQARTWQVELGISFPVAVNLSAAQFRHQNLLQTIHSALVDAHLHPSSLEIELTETALMTNPEESAGALKQLRRMGVSVAIDDFGTGYSSLSYLRRFPIDKLKIDRSFIRDLTVSHTDESIVRAIVSLARSVGLRVVAEGIETVEQLEFITRLECDQWQGYHCCAPQPVACFEAMLADRTGTRTGIVAALAALVTRGTDT